MTKPQPIWTIEWFSPAKVWAASAMPFMAFTREEARYEVWRRKRTWRMERYRVAKYVRASR